MIQFLLKWGHIVPLALILSLPVGLLGTWLLGFRRPGLRRAKAFAKVALSITLLSMVPWCAWIVAKNRDPYNLESVQLPPGYRLRQGPGEDSYCGRITSPDGTNISIDIGAMAGMFADPEQPERYLWISKGYSHGQDYYIGLMPPQGRAMEKPLLCVSYPQHQVNFMVDAENDQKVAEMLAIILTYVPRR